MMFKNHILHTYYAVQLWARPREDPRLGRLHAHHVTPRVHLHQILARAAQGAARACARPARAVPHVVWSEIIVVLAEDVFFAR